MPNPFGELAKLTVGKVVADSWTATMLSLWQAGLWLLKLVLGWIDALMTPDLSEHGPGGELYRTTFWLAGTLAVAMLLVQLGLAAFRRSGQSLAVAAVGAGKFLIVWAGWLTYGVAVVAACGGISRALLGSMLHVESWRAWQPWEAINTSDITDAAVATVLGLLGLLVWLAAVGHLLVMITRAGALIVLAAMTPMAAAGLLAEPGQSWFWKSFRWFHAAAFTPPLMIAMLGVGVQMTSGVATGTTDTTQAAIGTALPGVILILVSCVAPLALFKLLAFTDPTTNSGAAFRSGLAAVGGIGGLIGGRGAAAGQDSADTAEVDEPGSGGGDRSAGEAAADDQTMTRFAAQLAGVTGGPVGAAVGGVVVSAQTAASTATAVGSDLTNQMGVGHTSWHPDQTTSPYATDDQADGGYADQGGEADRPSDPTASDQNGGDWGGRWRRSTSATHRTPTPGRVRPHRASSGDWGDADGCRRRCCR